MNPLVLADDDSELPEVLTDLLETGGVLVFPTDTVYGIGGNPWDLPAVRRVRRLKGRAADRPFALLLPATNGIETFADVSGGTGDRVRDLLPGPITVIVRATGEGVPPAVIQDGKVGIRVPDHPFFSGVMRRVGRPLFGTSANRSGDPPLCDIERILEAFHVVDLVVTSDVPPSGIASAVIDLTCEPPRALRGVLPRALR